MSIDVLDQVPYALAAMIARALVVDIAERPLISDN